MARVRRTSRPQDFEQALASRSRASNVYFSVHHLARPPARPAGRFAYLGSQQLSTGRALQQSVAVDEVARNGTRPAALADSVEGPQGLWLGMVIPKRYARRSVTRNLIRREIRAGVQRHAPALQPGIWVVRLRAPFEPARYVSAASSALRYAVRTEVDAVLRSAAHPDR